MKLLTEAQREKLVDNGRRQAPVRGTERELDFEPVVKLFTPDAGATWLLTEIEPDAPDIAWGLCDLGVGCAEFGTVSLAELADVRGCLGLPVERDLSFKAIAPISAYVEEALKTGRIVEHFDASRYRRRG